MILAAKPVEPKLALPTALTFDNADKILAQLLAANELNSDIDLSTVTHCDSAGLAALIEAKAIFNTKEQAINYLNASTQLHDLAVFLKVDDLLFA